MKLTLDWNGTTTTAEIPNEERAGAILRTYARAAGIRNAAPDEEKARAVIAGILKHLRSTAQAFKDSKAAEAAALAAAANKLEYADPEPAPVDPPPPAAAPKG